MVDDSFKDQIELLRQVRSPCSENHRNTEGYASAAETHIGPHPGTIQSTELSRNPSTLVVGKGKD